MRLPWFHFINTDIHTLTTNYLDARQAFETVQCRHCFYGPEVTVLLILDFANSVIGHKNRVSCGKYENEPYHHCRYKWNRESDRTSAPLFKDNSNYVWKKHQESEAGTRLRLLITTCSKT